MQIKLATDWVDGDNSYPKGTILEVDEATAKDLVFNRTGERYEKTESETRASRKILCFQ